jgi:hypothetical protein
MTGLALAHVGSRPALRAAEYRQKAEAAARAASTSALEHVRAMHARAAARWLELAQAEDLQAREMRIFRGSAPQVR